MHAATFAALGEPRRLEIVELLRRRPLSVGDWVESFEVLWEGRLDSLEDVLAAMQAAREDAQAATDYEEGST